MKKNLLVVFVVLSMLMMFAGTAAAAPSSDGTATLVSAENGPSGAVFIFSVTGEFSKSQLNGTAQVEGGDGYGLHCSQVDDSTVRCLTSEKVGGKNVKLSWGGLVFWTDVPEAPSAPTQYCYDVYDWNADGPPYVEWVNFGTYCQDSPANYGDFITWYNPGWDDTYDYEFLPESPDAEWCSFYQPGDAYYYPSCPE